MGSDLYMHPELIPDYGVKFHQGDPRVLLEQDSRTPKADNYKLIVKVHGHPGSHFFARLVKHTDRWWLYRSVNDDQPPGPDWDWLEDWHWAVLG